MQEGIIKSIIYISDFGRKIFRKSFRLFRIQYISKYFHLFLPILTLKHISHRRLRKSCRLFLYISIYFYLFLPISVYSQSDSLYHYLEIAAKNNPTVLQRFSEYKAAMQKIPQVGSLSDPELSLGVFLTPMYLMDGKQKADIRLMQMFPWFGVLRYAKDEMSMMARAKFELFLDAKLQVFYDVQRSWYELYKNEKEISISEKNIDILKLIERLALVRFKSASQTASGTNFQNVAQTSTQSSSSAMQTTTPVKNGMATAVTNQPTSSMQKSNMSSAQSTSGLVDIYRIQIEYGDLENNIALLRNQQKSIAAQFNTFLNRPVSSHVYTGENIIMDSLEFSLSTIADSILAHNPILSMLDYEKQSQEARKKMVTRMGYPMVGLGVNYSIIGITPIPMGFPSMNGKDMVMPMVVFTLPVYRKKYVAMRNEAELMKEASSENYQATANSLQTEFYQAVSLYQDARRRVKLYDNQFQLASKSFDLILKDFSTSSAELTDVLRIRQQTLDYELKKVEAIADFNTAIAWLRRLMANPEIQ
jgi:outer membrane protein TolC